MRHWLLAAVVFVIWLLALVVVSSQVDAAAPRGHNNPAPALQPASPLADATTITIAHNGIHYGQNDGCCPILQGIDLSISLVTVTSGNFVNTCRSCVAKNFTHYHILSPVGFIPNQPILGYPQNSLCDILVLDNRGQCIPNSYGFFYTGLNGLTITLVTTLISLTTTLSSPSVTIITPATVAAYPFGSVSVVISVTSSISPPYNPPGWYDFCNPPFTIYCD